MRFNFKNFDTVEKLEFLEEQIFDLAIECRTEKDKKAVLLTAAIIELMKEELADEAFQASRG